MTTVKYTLDEFVHDTKALMRDTPDTSAFLNRGVDLLERLIRNPDCLPPQLRVPSGNGTALITAATCFIVTCREERG